MVKPLLLLLCCVVLFRSVRAQTPPDTVIPQKLQLKKADLAWTGLPNYLAKKSTNKESTDTVQSLMHVEPARKDSMNLRLPSAKANKVDIQVKTGPREPLFRRQ